MSNNSSITESTASVADGELIAMLRAQDWARRMMDRIRSDGQHPFHAQHSLVSECLAAMMGVDIETSRLATTTMLNAMLSLPKPPIATAPATADGSAEPDASNVLNFQSKERTSHAPAAPDFTY